MKKTILASAILLVAGAANAAEVYNNEGASVTLGGSFRANAVIQDSDNVKFEDAGSRFDIAATNDLGNGITVLGAAEIRRTDVGDSLFLKKSYVGLEHDVYGTVTMGKQYGLNDDLFYYDFSYMHGNIYQEDNKTLGNDTEDQLKYVKSFAGATVVVSLMDQDTYAIGGEYEVAGLTVGATYNMANDRAGFDNSNYVVSAKYAIDALTVAASYTASDVADVDVDAYGLAAKYALGQASAYIMFDSTQSDVKADEYTELVVGADYELAEGVVAYAEFGANNPETGSSDEVLYVGGRYYF